MEDKERVNIVFVGHVDAGKSTIAGQCLLTMGMIDERTIQKYKQDAKLQNRASWYLAYVFDQTDEERSKGKTMEVGKAYFDTFKKQYIIIDVPGHKNLVNGMIEGTAQADIGILVISAKIGEFESGFHGGQTKEHAILCKVFGVQLIVAINKIDEVNEERIEECKEILNTFLKTINFKDVIFIPVSGISGKNIKLLIDTLDQFSEIKRSYDKPRLCISNKNDDIIYGKVETGIFNVGEYNIEQIFEYKDDIKIDKKSAKSGDMVYMKIKGYVDKAIGVKLIDTFDVQLKIIELLPHKPIFSVGYKCIIHINILVDEAICERLYKIENNKPIRYALNGSTVIARFKTSMLPIESFNVCPQFGRIALRDEGKTIAFGKVLNI